MTYDGTRVCNVPDNIGDVACQWPFRDVSIFASGNIGQVQLAEAVELSLPAWNGVCGVRLSMTANSKTAHIALAVGQIDGPGNILAQNELPCGFSVNRWQQLRGLYDLQELAVISQNPPSNKIDLVRVCAHELGHGLGVGHLPMGNLMAPTYSTNIRLPQNGDIVEVRARYGPPVVITPPTTPFAPPTPGTITPMPPIPPNTPIDFGVLLRLLGAWGIDIAAKMTPAERAFVIDFVLRMIRSFSPQQRMEAAEAMRAAGMPITLD